MNQNRKKSGFYFRGFTTFALTAVSLVIAASGIVLYLTPRGRVAHWTNWTLGGLGKEQWGAIHMTAAALFLLVVGVHLFFNWKVLLGYLRLKRIPGLRLKRELAAAVVLGVLLVYGTLVGIPPLGEIVDLREGLKDYWESPSARAPVPHAEELTLSELAHELDLPVDDVVATLENHGFENAEPSAPVERIAKANTLAPSELYHILRPERDHGTPDPPRIGRGTGRLTLGEYASRESLPMEVVTEILSKRGIRAGASTPLQQIAGSLDMRPGELARLLTEEAGGTPVESGRTDCPSYRSDPS